MKTRFVLSAPYSLKWSIPVILAIETELLVGKITDTAHFNEYKVSPFYVYCMVFESIFQLILLLF